MERTAQELVQEVRANQEELRQLHVSEREATAEIIAGMQGAMRGLSELLGQTLEQLEVSLGVEDDPAYQPVRDSLLQAKQLDAQIDGVLRELRA